MKVFIKRQIVLKGIRNTYFSEFCDFLNNHGIPYSYSNDDDNKYTVHLNPTTTDARIVVVNLSYEDMKVFLNTVERHYFGKIQFEYLGDMRFDLILP